MSYISSTRQVFCGHMQDKLRLYNWCSRKNWWEENEHEETLCGGVEILESVFKRSNGKNKILGSARDEFMNPYLISVCSNDQHQGSVEKSKKLGHLLDLKTTALEGIVFGSIEVATATDDGDLNRAITLLYEWTRLH